MHKEGFVMGPSDVRGLQFSFFVMIIFFIIGEKYPALIDFNETKDLILVVGSSYLPFGVWYFKDIIDEWYFKDIFKGLHK